MFATYCIFTAIIFRFLFGEKLGTKFLIGMLFMLACVSCISLQSLGSGGFSENTILALGLGIFAPFMISLTISVSKYWTINYHYKSLDFTIDTFLCMSLIEIGFSIYYELNTGYTFKEVLFAFIASIFQILGTMLMIYSATFGLAGPASAMVQSQCVVQTILATIFLHQIPRPLDIVGIACAIIGAIVMSVELNCFKFL